jgi:hypothetical protein
MDACSNPTTAQATHRVAATPRRRPGGCWRGWRRCRPGSRWRRDDAIRHGFHPVRAGRAAARPPAEPIPTTAANRLGTAVQLVDELSVRHGRRTIGRRDRLPQGGRPRGRGARAGPAGRMRRPVHRGADHPRRPPPRPGRPSRARVLPKAGRRSLYQHREAIARAVASIAPRTAARRHESAGERRRLEFRSDADGMAWLSVYGPAPTIPMCPCGPVTAT